jgi:hypothetical protein
MAVHRFKVGQRVSIRRRHAQLDGSGDYKIIRLMPASEGENQYRVKGNAEPFERVVKESEIVRP